MIYKYFILFLSICILYYLLFKYNHGKEWGRLSIFAALAGLFASIGRILTAFFPSNKYIIENIFSILTVISVVIFFYLAIPLAWKMRKDPSRKIMINMAFGLLLFLFVFIIIVLVLIKFGFYD